MASYTMIKLSDIRSLTFYADEKTLARRSAPIAQLKCIGKPCRTYQPDVVRCVNTGGSGVDVDWKCESDLPSSLRFGRVEVSCEGWSRPGDPYVLKGSCGLEYHLQALPKSYHDGQAASHRTSTIDYFNSFVDWGFYLLAIAVLLFMAYHLITSCLSRPQPPGNGPRRDGGGRGGGGGGGWFNSWPGGTNAPGAPPPYSKYASDGTGGTARWTPGFWTGLGFGGLIGRLFPPTPFVPYAQPQPRFWDWERPRYNSWRSTTYDAPPPQGSQRARMFDSDPRDDDRGEGSSSGVMRRSTGYGGSRVR